MTERFYKVVEGMKYARFYSGLALTIFNVCVFIFTQSEISPKYFEWLFALYFLISMYAGFKLMHEGLVNRYVYWEKVRNSKQNTKRRK